ncbi:MAG: helix-turn-helix domain-containing protein [Bacteroidota bacterium]
MEDEKYPGLKITPEYPEGSYDWALLYYNLDESGDFSTVMTANHMERLIPLKEHWENIYDRVQIAKRKVLNGEASPLLYFMERTVMDLTILSGYADIAKWKVKRHMKPKVFKNLNTAVLEKYAAAFGISIDELLSIK